MAYTGATQSYIFPRTSTEMPASQLAGTQPLSDGIRKAGHGATHDHSGQAFVQSRQQQDPAEKLHGAGRSPQAPSTEVAGPSECEVNGLLS